MNNKIFMVCAFLLNGKDARTTHILEVYRNLMKFDDIYLFAPRPEKKKMDLQSHNVIFIPCIKSFFKPLFYQFFLFFYLLYYTFKQSPDVIYCRQSGLSISPLLISMIFRIPYIVEVNGLRMEEMEMSDKPKIFIIISKICEKLNFSFAKKIVVVTPSLKTILHDIHNISCDKIEIIQNGANINLFKSLDQTESREKLDIAIKQNYICFIGHLAPWQGVEYLTQAAPRILEVYSNTRFLIVGDGSMKTKWMQFVDELGISENFIFPGIIPYEQVPIYINASDVCVTPKKPIKSGYSPLKLYEYMACGKPVVATRTNGFEIIEKYDAGILINPENSKEFADAIISLLKSKDIRNRMGKNGRELVSKNYSWERVAQKISDVCKNVTV